MTFTGHKTGVEMNTLPLIQNIISAHPWWVYVLYIYLLKIGLVACKNNNINIYRAFVLPTIIISLSIYTATKYLNIQVMLILAFIIGKTVGLTSGWLSLKNKMIWVDKKNHLLTMPGSFNTLVLILIFLTTRIGFTYMLAKEPYLINNTKFIMLVLLIESGISGIFLGRFMNMIYRFKKGPFKEIKEHLD